MPWCPCWRRRIRDSTESVITAPSNCASSGGFSASAIWLIVRHTHRISPETPPRGTLLQRLPRIIARTCFLGLEGERLERSRLPQHRHPQGCSMAPEHAIRLPANCSVSHVVPVCSPHPVAQYCGRRPTQRRARLIGRRRGEG